jgi:predicted type IV restriction endonuclease
MADFDFEIYSGKSFKDLCRDIVTRSDSKKDQLDTLLTDVRTLIKDKNDAIILLPQLKSLMEVGVKNDEQLVKLVAVMQRLQSTQIEASGGADMGLSDEEREQLLAEVKTIEKEVKTPVPPLSGSTPV